MEIKEWKPQEDKDLKEIVEMYMNSTERKESEVKIKVALDKAFNDSLINLTEVTIERAAQKVAMLYVEDIKNGVDKKKRLSLFRKKMNLIAKEGERILEDLYSLPKKETPVEQTD